MYLPIDLDWVDKTRESVRALIVVAGARSSVESTAWRGDGSVPLLTTTAEPAKTQCCVELISSLGSSVLLSNSD